MKTFDQHIDTLESDLVRLWNSREELEFKSNCVFDNDFKNWIYGTKECIKEYLQGCQDLSCEEINAIEKDLNEQLKNKFPL